MNINKLFNIFKTIYDITKGRSSKLDKLGVLTIMIDLSLENSIALSLIEFLSSTKRIY